MSTEWDDDPDYPVEDWQIEVAHRETLLSYRDWVEHERERDGLPARTYTSAKHRTPSETDVQQELLARMTRMETRLCKLMENLNINPGKPEGYPVRGR